MAKHREAPQVPACAVCKRRNGDGHDDFCTPERRDRAEADRLAAFPPPPMVTRRITPTPNTAGGAGPEIINLSFLDPEPVPDHRSPTVKAAHPATEPDVKPHSLAAAMAKIAPEPPPGDKVCLACSKPWPATRAYWITKRNGQLWDTCKVCHSQKIAAAKAMTKDRLAQEATSRNPAADATEKPETFPPQHPNFPCVMVPVLPVSEADEAIVDELVQQAAPAGDVEPLDDDQDGPIADQLTQLRQREADLQAKLQKVQGRIADLALVQRMLDELQTEEILAGLQEAERRVRLATMALKAKGAA